MPRPHLQKCWFTSFIVLPSHGYFSFFLPPSPEERRVASRRGQPTTHRKARGSAHTHCGGYCALWRSSGREVRRPNAPSRIAREGFPTQGASSPSPPPIVSLSGPRTHFGRCQFSAAGVGGGSSRPVTIAHTPACNPGEEGTHGQVSPPAHMRMTPTRHLPLRGTPACLPYHLDSPRELLTRLTARGGTRGAHWEPEVTPPEGRLEPARGTAGSRRDAHAPTGGAWWALGRLARPCEKERLECRLRKWARSAWRPPWGMGQETEVQRGSAPLP